MTKQNPASWLAWPLRRTPLRALLALLPVLLYATSCTEGPGGGVTDPGDRGVRLGLVPQYHYSGAAFAPVTRVRLTVLRQPGNDTLFTGIQPIEDPNAASWNLTLQFDLPAGVQSADVVVLLELLSNAGIEWSGKTSPISVSPAETSQPSAPINLFQGPPANLDVQGVEITTAPTTLVEGDSASLVALISPAGQGQVFWSSLDTLVATVSPGGVVRTRRDGTVRIRASAGPAGDTATIVVRQRAASVRIQPDTARASSVGQAVTFTAAVLDPRGAAIAGATVEWSSLHPAIAESQGSGQYLARSNGTATIVATSTAAPGIAGNARLIVAQQPTSVQLLPGTTGFDALGARSQFTATALDANGNVVPAAGFTWSSSAPAVATVDATGMVTAVGNGTARITVTASSGSNASVDVTVQQVLAAVQVTPAPYTFTAVGDTVRFSARPVDSNGNAMPGTVAWTSSDPAVVTVDASGLARSVASGSARVVASAGTISGAAEVSVAPTFTRLEITPAQDTLRAVGATLAFTARGFDRNGNLTAALPAWSSSDPAVATIDAAGVATATGPGTTTITARAGEVQAAATLVVVQRATTVEILPDSLAIAGAGASGSFTATVRDARGAAVTGAVIAWSSLDPEIATVNENGVVTGVRRGLARIVASSGGAADTARAYVAGTSVTITPDTLRLAASFDTASFSAIVRNATGQVLTQRIVWTSLQPLIAQVDSTGRVTALNAGTASIVATALDAADTAVVVFQPVVTRLAITPAVDTVAAGATVSLSANGFDARGVDVPVEVAWSSADSTIAAVDAQGNVTGRLAGSVTITASAGDVSATATVLVTGAPDLVILDFTVTPDTVSVGDSVQVSIAVRNVGTQSSAPTALVLRALNAATGGVLRDSVMPVPSLPPSGTLSVTRWIRIFEGYSWPPAITLVAIVDPAEMVAESNEENNSAQRGPIVVRSAPPPPSDLPADVVMHAGETLQLASALPGRTWSTSNTYVATVDTAGNVHANMVGAVRVFASGATAVDTILVWIVPPGFTRAWVGTSANRDYHEPNNWSPAGVPTGGDHIFIPDCYSYLIADCAPPILSADAGVASLSTGYPYYYYYSAQLARPESGAARLRADRQPGGHLSGAARTDYLARRAERDSARAAQGRPVLRMLDRTPKRPASHLLAPPARSVSGVRPAPSVAASSSYGLHVDLNGHAFTVTGLMPYFTALGSDFSAVPGILRLAGNGTMVAGLDLAGNLEITGTNVIVGDDDYADVDGNVTVTGSAHLELWSHGNLVVNGGTIFTGYDLGFSGNATLTNATINLEDSDFYVEGDLVMTGGSFNYLDWGYVDVYGSTTITNGVIDMQGGYWETYGDMLVDGGRIDLFDGDIEVGDYYWDASLEAYVYTGNLTLRNGAILALAEYSWVETYGDFITASNAYFTQEQYTYIDIVGDASFDGGSTAGRLLGGELYIYGNLTVGNSTTPTAFAPSGDHWTEFGTWGGTGIHMVQMASPGPAGNRFHHLEVNYSSDEVRFLSPMWIMGDLENDGDIVGSTVYVGGDTWSDGMTADEVTVNGSLYVTSEGTAWEVGRTVINTAAGDHINGGLLTGNVEIFGQPALYYLSVTGDLDLRGSADVSFDYYSVDIAGAVRVRENAVLRLTGTTTQMGSLQTMGSGRVVAVDYSEATVTGAVTFSGGVNQLAGGVLNVGGSLTSSGGRLGASGGQEFRLNGTTEQAVDVEEMFANLLLANSAGILLQRDLLVTGTFAANGSGVRATAIRHVAANNASIFNFTANRVWLNLGNTTDATLVDVSNLTFTGFQSGDAVPAQLRISLPGVVDVSRSGFAFDAVAGGSFIELHGSTVKFHFSTATPTTPPASRFSGTGRIYYNGIGVLNPLPNLRAHGWILSPGFPFQYGDSITLKTITSNPGTIATPASTVRTQIRDAVTSAVLVEWTNPVPALSPGQIDTVANRTRVNESWPTSAAIHIFVDPELLVTEDNEGDNTSVHSNIAVTQPAPRLLFPDDRSMFHHFPRTLDFSWTTFPGAVGYEFEWGYCESVSPTDPWNCLTWVDYSPISLTATSHSATHVGDQMGRWRVRAVLSAGAYSDWAPYKYFDFETYMDITPVSATIATAASTQLTVMTGLANPAVTWRSENELVATVSATGLVYGVAPGTTTIRATSVTDDTIYATATITVTATPSMVQLRSTASDLVDGRWRPAASGRSFGSRREP